MAPLPTNLDEFVSRPPSSPVEMVLAHAPLHSCPDTALWVGPNGRWMQPPQRKPQDLRRRKHLRRILGALARQHESSPTQGITLGELVLIGWPDERIAPEAGTNRIYVALATLRKFGLRGLLHCHQGRYFLDRSLTIRRSTLEWDAL